MNITINSNPFLLIIIAYLFILSSCNTTQNRVIIPLNEQWTFCVDSAMSGDRENWGVNGLPGNLTRLVSIPHAWNADKGLEKYSGVCWYEYKYDMPEEQLEKTTRLQFDAVYHDATIYVNGAKAGEHIGSGYNRFFIDVSAFLKAGLNTYRIRVDNSFSRNNIPFAKSFDWANDGGIIRNVFQIITSRQAIKNVQVVATPSGSKGTANIRINVLDQSKIDPSKLTFTAIIKEENQSTRKQLFKGILNGKYENGSFFTSLQFDKVNPWHFDSPNLYKLYIKLIIDGIEKDEYSTVFGFRKIEVKNNRYILNGEPVRLMGVEWMPGSTLERGMAETPADFEKHLSLMKNANCIFTRFHWQQDEYIFDWCDRNGILVQEEIPYWGGATLLNDTLLQKGIQHLDEMTDAHFNHPSIILWGIGNELDSHIPVNISGLKILYDHAKSIDSSRLVSYVSSRLHYRPEGDLNRLPDATANFDVMMFNEYFSTWGGKSIDAVPGELDWIADTYPGKPLTISEWGICEPFFKGGDPRRTKEMAQQITIYSARDFITGAIYFCLNDYRTHMGEDFTYSYPQRVHGICDIKGNLKQSYDTLKLISSPIEIRSIRKKEGKVFISLYGKTGIPSYTVRNYIIIAGDLKIPIIELKPGAEQTYEIKSDVNEFSIIRPTGFEVLHVKMDKL